METSRILMVDDEEDLELLVRQRFRRRIRKGEFDFVFAKNGKDALEKLAENPDIRLVLSDINMPVMDGLTLLGQLESINPEIQAVIISAYGDMANIRTAMNRGAFDFVTKPIDFNDLLITIEKTLKHIHDVEEALKSRDRLVALKQELDVARQVQMASLPGALPAGQYFDIHAYMSPAREIGGDFYDFFDLDEFRLGLVIADVSDKGVPAALVTLVTRALLKCAALNQNSPAHCLREVNEFLSEDNDSCMFVTLFYGILDLRTGRLHYCNGGHNPPWLVRSGGGAEPVPTTKDIAIGLSAGQEFNEGEVTLAAGDLLFLYTDGITEACNGNSDEFGEQRLHDLLEGLNQVESKAAVGAVVEAVEAFADGAPQFDDMTCLSLRLTAMKPAESAAG